MTTPSRRLSGDSRFTNNGPSRSVLQKLLEEINDAGRSATRNVGESPKTSDAPGTSNNDSTPRTASLSRRNSVWVANSAIAQDARDKLRSLDEARQMKHCIGGSQVRPASLPTSRRDLSSYCGIHHKCPRSCVWRTKMLSPTSSYVESNETASAASVTTRAPSPSFAHPPGISCKSPSIRAVGERLCPAPILYLYHETVFRLV